MALFHRDDYRDCPPLAIANPLEPEYPERRSKEFFGAVAQDKTFSVNSIRFGANAPLFVIAGPCVIESESHALRMAESLGAVATELGVPYIFKASYDKAKDRKSTRLNSSHRR